MPLPHSMAKMKGGSNEEALGSIREKFWPILKVNWVVWPVAQVSPVWVEIAIVQASPVWWVVYTCSTG